MADKRLMRGGALHVYGESGDYRYGVEDNGDIPGCVDIYYEGYNSEAEQWERSGPYFECVAFEALVALAEGARVIRSWEAGEDLPTSLTVEVKVLSTPPQRAV